MAGKSEMPRFDGDMTIVDRDALAGYLIWLRSATQADVEGKLPWRQSVKEFWDRFEVDLETAEDKMQSYKAGIPTGEKCEKCGQGELLERISRHGFFLGCSRYPECDYIRDLSEAVSSDADATTFFACSAIFARTAASGMRSGSIPFLKVLLKKMSP